MQFACNLHAFRMQIACILHDFRMQIACILLAIVTDRPNTLRQIPYQPLSNFFFSAKCPRSHLMNLESIYRGHGKFAFRRLHSAYLRG